MSLPEHEVRLLKNANLQVYVPASMQPYDGQTPIESGDLSNIGQRDLLFFGKPLTDLVITLSYSFADQMNTSPSTLS